MSGIAVSYGTSEEADLRRMLSKLEHRGELTGMKVMGNVTFGYRSNHYVEGDGPADEVSTFASNGGIYAVCDGNLYHDEAAGHDESSYIADSFREKGNDFVEDLEGTFALAVAEKGSLLVARDQFGIKPLYYGQEDGVTYFASEIKELAEVTDDINIFPPGHYFTPRQGFKPYNNQESFEAEKALDNPYKAARHLHKIMTRAVEKRIFDGEHPGVLLSGGLDSSAVAAAARKFYPKLETFAVGLAGCADLEAARIVARYIGSSHYEYIFTEEEMMKYLPEVIYYLESFDAPLVQSSMANFFASRLAAEAGCHSVLCGEGADELFGGYHYFKHLKSEEEVKQEMQKIVSIGHGMSFQRVDRMNSAHSLEAHVPYMDAEVFDFAFKVPIEWKIYGSEEVEKWVLRTAFQDDLPHEIAWRRKAQFSHGSGCSDVLAGLAEEKVSDEEYRRIKEQNPDVNIRSKEECLYFKIFREFYPQDSAADTVVQWACMEGDNV